MVLLPTCLLLYGFALQTVHNLKGAVPFTPVDTISQLAAAWVVGSHRWHQADLRPHHAVEHGQLTGDALHTLAHRDLHATDFTTVRVTCKMSLNVDRQ